MTTRRKPSDDPLPGFPGERRDDASWLMEQHKARPRWPGMQAKRDDNLKDSFYLYIMRNSIGAGLRSQYAPNEHMPDRLAELLHELDDIEDHVAQEEPKPQPTRRHVQKK